MATLGTNSFVSVTEANAYFVNHIEGAAWDTTAIGEEALVTASGILNRLSWKGTCTPTSALPLAWPRNITTFVPLNGSDVTLTDDRETVTNPVGGTVPTFIKEATYELALHLVMNSSTLQSNESGSAPVRDLTVGSIRLTFDLSSRTRKGYIDLPEIVQSIIRPYTSSSSTSVFVNGGA